MCKLRAITLFNEHCDWVQRVCILRLSILLMCIASWLSRQCIEACRVGAKLREVHHLSVRVLSEGLCELGIFPGLDSSSIAHNAYRSVYPHSVGRLQFNDLIVKPHEHARQQQDLSHMSMPELMSRVLCWLAAFRESAAVPGWAILSSLTGVVEASTVLVAVGGRVCCCACALQDTALHQSSTVGPC